MTAVRMPVVRAVRRVMRGRRPVVCRIKGGRGWAEVGHGRRGARELGAEASTSVTGREDSLLVRQRRGPR